MSAAALVVVATVSCGSSSRPEPSVAPRYPNVFGTAIAEQPDHGGDLFVPRHGVVTLTLADGRRLVVPPSVDTLGATGLLCRTRNLNRADGSYAPPCRLQLRAVHGRAVWLRVIGTATVGMAVSGSPRWLVLADGTAVPMPAPPRRPVVNCPSVKDSGRVEVFSRVHHLVRFEVDDDGTLARVDCQKSIDVK